MSSEIYYALFVTLKVAGLSSLVVMSLSWWLGGLFAHTEHRLLRLIELLIYVPMAMPPVALGFGLLMLVGPQSILGFYLSSIGIEIAFTFWGAVMASVVASLGIGVRTMKTAFLSLDSTMIDIAHLHGATWLQQTRFIRLPLLMPTFIAATILVFLRCLGEFGATIVLAGNQSGETRTLALAIWTTLQRPGSEQETLLLVTISIALSLVALLLSELLLKRKFK